MKAFIQAYQGESSKNFGQQKGVCQVMDRLVFSLLPVKFASILLVSNSQPFEFVGTLTIFWANR